MRREVKRLSRSRTALFAVAIAALGPTLLSSPWADSHLGAHFVSQLLIVAVGLPCLIVLARNAPLAALEPDASKRSPPPSRGRRASGRQRPRALPARKVGPPVAQPDRVRLAARLAVGLGVWLLVATVLSPQPAVAFFGLQARANGALLGLALVAAWAIGVSSGRDAAAAIESVLLGVVGLNAIVALVQTISGVGLASGRAQGLFGNPVFLAGLLSGGLWLVIQRFRTDQRWGWAVVLVVAATQTTGSRFALILLPVVVVASFFVLTRRRTALLVLAIVAGVGLGGGLAAVGGASSATARAGQGIAGGGFSQRLEIWSWSMHAIKHRPIQGQGPGQVQAATERFKTLAFSRHDPEPTFDDAHNLIVEYLVTTGVPGAALLIAFTVMTLLLAGWRSPLGGFAIFTLALHGVEPPHAELTPLLFLALGAAASGAAPLLIGVPRALRPALVSVAVVVGGVIAVGSVYGTSSPSTPSRAYADARIARRLLPMWSSAYSRTGRIDVDHGKFKDAARWLRIAAEREPYQAFLWSQLAFAEEQTGHVADAEAHYRRALEDNHYSVDTLNRLVALLVRNGRSQDARVYVQRSLQVTPNQPSLRKLLQ